VLFYPEKKKAILKIEGEGIAKRMSRGGENPPGLHGGWDCRTSEYGSRSGGKKFGKRVKREIEKKGRKAESISEGGMLSGNVFRKGPVLEEGWGGEFEDGEGNDLFKTDNTIACAMKRYPGTKRNEGGKEKIFEVGI